MEPTEYARGVAERIAAAIDAAGLTRREVAAASKGQISEPAMSRLINGKNKRKRGFDGAQVYAIAAAITELAPDAAVTVSDLMGDL